MKNGKVILWSILGTSILFAGIILGVIMSASDSDIKQQPVVEPTEEPTVVEEVAEPVADPVVEEPAVVAEENTYKSDYIEGCSPNGITNMEYCECTYDYLVKETGGEKEFLAEAVKFVETGTSPDIITDAAISCFYLYEE